MQRVSVHTCVRALMREYNHTGVQGVGLKRGPLFPGLFLLTVRFVARASCAVFVNTDFRWLLASVSTRVVPEGSY